MNLALIFAGGVGKRMHSGDVPKQFLCIQNKPVLIHTLERFDSHSEIDAICVVSAEDRITETERLIQVYGMQKVRWIVPGGSTALESQYFGLKAMQADETDIVLIHDGVRPLIDAQTIHACIQSVREFGSAITVAPATETILRRGEDGAIAEVLDRSQCLLARAPQCFRIRDIMAAHERAIAEKHHDFIDSVSMMLCYGYPMHCVMGSPENLKVTTPTDFYICRALLEAETDVSSEIPERTSKF